MRRLARAGLALVAWCALGARADAGHEFPFYPSFYPQEIQIEVVAPDLAARRLTDGSLHAWVGPDPFPGGPPPGVTALESLAGYVVVTPTPGAAGSRDGAGRCRVARRVVAGLRARGAGWTFHPYPVTPYHEDFLQHADRAEAARQAHGPLPGAAATPRPRVELRGEAARRLFGPPAAADPAGHEATVEVVEVADLSRPAAIGLNGWLGPPWLRAGFFQTYLLQAPALADPAVRAATEATLRRLTTGAAQDPVERLNLERALVARLGDGCERLVAGYTLRREYVNSEYSGGVENVGADAQTGLLSPIFPRTVKLKDFPWNGWLTLGVPRPPAGPWNPVAGFDDPASRLAWMAVGDPAFLPAPHAAGWVANRVTAALAAGVGGARPDVAPDALLPEPASGRLLPVGPGRRSDLRVRYRVLASAFHDGTRMTVGDVVYPYVAAARWGTAGSPVFDPAVARQSALVRERLAGLQVLRVETDVLAFGEDKLTYEVPVVDVYLRDVPPDPGEAAALAPPWSTLPWHLLVVMEEAVTRGLAALSGEAAGTRGVPVIDLVRAGPLRDGLARIVDDLAQRGQVPEALRGFATPAEARERYIALKAFHAQHGHFLVTNGPYQLTRAPGAATPTVLKVFRDLSYPRGVGAFNAHVIPLRAQVTRVARRGERLELGVEVEKVERYGRDVKVVREPFSIKASETDQRSLPLCHYVVVGPDGAIVKAGTVRATDPGMFVVDPTTPGARPGPHTVLIALSLDQNRVNPAIQVVPWTP